MYTVQITAKTLTLLWNEGDTITEARNYRNTEAGERQMKLKIAQLRAKGLQQVLPWHYYQTLADKLLDL